uniref:Integrase catalytic domain-containing protein n=1 Tax=Tanacetum cinerariifolium TaxID=118510 RepID=A0A6L2NX77_TANCI|nr:hypothetical protein [Tanacetum cinerariifolium]
MMKKSSSSESKPCCSKDCKKNTETLKKKITELSDKLFDANNMIFHYKLDDAKKRNPSVFETEASSTAITPKSFIKFVKPNDSPSKSKTDKTEIPKKPTVKYAEQYRKTNKKPTVRGNQRNWNNLKTHQLGTDFVMKKKACFNYGDFNHLVYDYRKRVRKSFTPKLVAHKPYRPLVRPVRTNMNDARPNITTFNKQAHSYANRPFQRTSTVRSQYRAPWVPTINKNFPSENFPLGSSQNHIDDKGYWDSSCSRHMTGNISYLSDYEPFDRGYVSFGQGGCKITRKGTIKTECIVLGRDFKLLDDANILLKTPRQHNMYFIDLNNIVPHRDLTRLVAKASADECMIWHRRLGKQHKASCKSKLVTSVSKPLHTLHMDLFGPTSISSISHKWYCLVVTDDFSREFSNVKTPQRNGVAERRNRSLIEAARIMLADAKLLVTIWAEAVNNACYVQNRVLVNKAHNKTPYELFNGRTPAIGFLKPFGCHVMILNTLDNLGKFEAKGDEGYFIRYSMSSKAFRVFNKRTKRVEENFHIEFLENKAIEKGFGPNWLFDIDSLTTSINYMPVVDAGTNSTNFLGTKVDARQDVKKDVSSLRFIVLPNWVHEEHLESTSSQPQDACNTDAPESSRNSNPTATLTNPSADQLETLTVETPIPIVSLPVLTVCFTDSQEPSSETRLISKRVTNQEKTPSLDNILTLSNQFEDILGVSTNSKESNGVEADVWSLIDCPKGVRPIRTKWVLKNKKDERGIVIRNKARLVAQRHTREEGIDYDEVFALVVRIKAIRLFLAYASFMGFTVYQMDVKSAFLYGIIDEEVYVMQPFGF